MSKYFSYFYIRYVIIFVLFVLVFVFGKNMNVLSPEQERSQNETYAQQKIILGIYDVPANESIFEIKNLYSVKKGQCGRLFFSLKKLSSNNNSIETVDENSKLKISLSNNFGSTRGINTYEVKSDKFVQNERADFCADDDYQNLLLEKDLIDQGDVFEISKIGFYPLAAKKHDLNNLIDPIVGNTDFSKIIYQSGLEINSANIPYKFTRHNQLIGQTFVADSDTIISGVDMKMGFIGVGGVGSYSLELREAEEKNGNVQPSQVSIASFQFNKESAKKELLIGNDIYHIPLASHLVKGKKYFLGVNNGAVKFNLINTLQIYGGSSDSREQVYTLIGGKSNGQTGHLFLRAYGGDYVKIEGEKVLTNSKILDDGYGSGYYIYSQKGDFSDFLDIFESSDSYTGQNDVFYDNINRSISASDRNDTYFTYKFNTVRPFNRMSVSLEQPGGAFTDSEISYSFDNKNWQTIKMETNEADDSIQTNTFKSVIKGDGNNKNVYIKVSYNKESQKKNQYQKNKVNLFGVKNIFVEAEIND